MFRGEKKKKLIGAGLGLGALLLALKFAVRRPTKEPVPDAISPAIFSTKVQRTSHGQMVYHESGSGQTLIFCHAPCLGGSSYEWSKVYPEFAATHRVLAPDWIGFGESERPSARLRAADHVRALADFIRATCWEQPPVLIGSGLGAGLCALLASQHPELVSRLILSMPTGRGDFGRTRLSFASKLIAGTPLLNRSAYRNHRSTKSAVRRWLVNSMFNNPGAVTDETVAVFTTCAQQYGAEHAMLNLSGLAFDLEARLKTLTQPVTLLWSEHAVFPPLDWARRFQEITPGSRLVILKNTGAFAALEDPPQVAGAIRDELEAGFRLYKVD